jgi:hypothetical protein
VQTGGGAKTGRAKVGRQVLPMLDDEELESVLKEEGLLG